MLPSHKEGIVYYEHCKLLVDDARLCVVRSEGALERYWSIPHAATLAILLGPGTSLTQAAAKMLGKEGVLIGFVGGEGVPIYFASQNEYRSTKYLHAWVDRWRDDNLRIEMAKLFQYRRVELLRRAQQVFPELENAEPDIERFLAEVSTAKSDAKIISEEGVLSKALYRNWAVSTGVDFRRDHKGGDLVNRNLSTGNYYAYGLSSAVLWTLGIPHGFSIVHGKTRRGGLVFDLADVIKDATIMPNAFNSSLSNETNSEFKARCSAGFDKFKAVEYLMNTVKVACDCTGN